MWYTIYYYSLVALCISDVYSTVRASSLEQSLLEYAISSGNIACAGLFSSSGLLLAAKGGHFLKMLLGNS